eukprot:9297266-Pyramimonas_sp.AAC.1
MLLWSQHSFAQAKSGAVAAVSATRSPSSAALIVAERKGPDPALDALSLAARKCWMCGGVPSHVAP